MQPLDFCLWAVSLDSFTDKQVEVGEKQVSHNLFKPERGRQRAGEWQSFSSKPQTHSSVGVGSLCVTGGTVIFHSSQQMAQVMLAVAPPSRRWQSSLRFDCVLRSANKCIQNLNGQQHISIKHGKITEAEGGHPCSLKETATKIFCRSGSGLYSHSRWKTWITNKDKGFSCTVIKLVRDWSETFPPRVFLCLLCSGWGRHNNASQSSVTHTRHP